jgi:hypothetical protein
MPDQHCPGCLCGDLTYQATATMGAARSAVNIVTVVPAAPYGGAPYQTSVAAGAGYGTLQFTRFPTANA